MGIYKIARYLMPFGMISVIIYFFHIFLGQFLWTEYDWITTDISSLTAKGAPDAGLLSIFTILSGVCAVIFFVGMIIVSLDRGYNKLTLTGYIFFALLMTISTFGYSLFPLEGDKSQMTLNNLMHIIVTAAVVILVLSSMYMLSFGYLNKEKMKVIGILTLVFAVIITITGLLTPIGMANNWNILGITERSNIFSLQVFIFIISFNYFFIEDKYS